VLGVSFCPMGKPTGTEFNSSISILFSAGWLLCLPPALTLVSCSPYSSTLKRETIFSFETSPDFQRTTQHYIPEDSTLNNISVKIITTTHSNIRVEPTPKTLCISNIHSKLDYVQHNICIMNQHCHKPLQNNLF
jgi:hypothetical protein